MVSFIFGHCRIEQRLLASPNLPTYRIYPDALHIQEHSMLSYVISSLCTNSYPIAQTWDTYSFFPFSLLYHPAFFLFLMETCSLYLSYGFLDPNISFSLTCQQNYLECLHSLSSNPLIGFFFEITLIELPTISHPTSRKLLLFRKVSNEFNLLNLSVTFQSLVYWTHCKHFMQLTILHHRVSLLAFQTSH